MIRAQIVSVTLQPNRWKELKMNTNWAGYKQKLSALARDGHKSVIEFIKGGEAPAQHDAVRVSKLRAGERIKPGKDKSNDVARTRGNRTAGAVRA